MQFASREQPDYAVATTKLNSEGELVTELVYEAFLVPGFLDALVAAIVLLNGKGGTLGDLSADDVATLKRIPGRLLEYTKVMVEVMDMVNSAQNL